MTTKAATEMTMRWSELINLALNPGGPPAERMGALEGLPRFSTRADAVMDAMEGVLLRSEGGAPSWALLVNYARFVRLARNPERHQTLWRVLDAVGPQLAPSDHALHLRRLLADAESPLATLDARRQGSIAARDHVEGRGASGAGSVIDRLEVALSAFFGELAPFGGVVDVEEVARLGRLALEALRGADPSWDGERHAVSCGFALALVQQERAALGAGAPVSAQDATTVAIRTALTDAARVAEKAGALSDLGDALAALTPLMLALGEVSDVRERLGAIVERCPCPEISGGLELKLRQLLVQTLGRANAPGPALTALYEAMNRCRELGAIVPLLALIVEGPQLYLQAGLPGEALNFLRLTREGFEKRTAADKEELLAFLDRVEAEVRLEVQARQPDPGPGRSGG